ncbi:MAG: ATP phosphoribosyltransferase (ATP-PRTase) (ATP-PRT) [Trichoglossum hirsutum]|nr:MAG: ATP phosphoribosyltransferase (ATP-PRTase) (ATP-PRT) [Trichoglossum hirsutum]
MGSRPRTPQLTDGLESLGGRLLFAVPKKGRLQQPTLDLLQGSDIQFHRHSRLDIALCINLPIALVFLPAADIPTFVGEGRVDLGITGRDQVAEHRAITAGEVGADVGVEEVLDLGFGRCKLQVQVPEKGHITDPVELVGKNVVTSFVSLSAAYFAGLEEPKENVEVTINGELPEAKKKLKTKIKYVGGSVEAACALGVADGIVDLVESGETMRAAGLKAIATVVESTAVLIESKHPSDPNLVNLITSRIKGVITAQKYVLCQYNVLRSELHAATRVTPGRRAPTVTSLEEPGWVAVSSMVLKKEIAVVMDELEKVGATDLLVLDIANSRTG